MRRLTGGLLHLPIQRLGRMAVSAALAACVLAAWTGAAAAQVQASFLYTLSNFEGRLPFDWARVYVDEEREETYIVFGNLVRVFNASGMEVHSFGDDLDVGLLSDIAIDRQGDILLLSYKDSQPLVTRCNFRGEPTGTLEISGLPDGVPFNPNRMVFRDGVFYFATLGASSVVITDEKGTFRERLEFLGRLEPDDRKKSGIEMIGFTVDRQHNVFFTMPVLFKVFKYAPDGTLTSFGRPGSIPGRFGILAGIAADSRGNLLVLDKLKSAVQVFDKDFEFVTAFGYRGARPENLIMPDSLAIDGRDRVYVTQGRRRGVSVFALAYE